MPGPISRKGRPANAVTAAAAETITNIAQGYYAVTTDFFNGGQANATQELVANTWTKLTLSEFEFRDYSPTASSGIADGTTYGSGNGVYDATEDRFSCAGLKTGTHCIVRVLLRCDPEEDESQLDIRLNFVTNSSTFPTGLEGFQIETVMLSMSQGADQFYSDEDLISFFVGETLKGDGWDDAGHFTVEAKSTVPATVEVMGLTLMSQI
jgi:hypothetical protein